MRILLVNTWYYPNMKGGAEQSVKLLAENLYKNGNVVGVLTADAIVENQNPEIINGVAVYRVKSYIYEEPISLIQKITRKSNDIKYTKNSKKILDVLERYKPDVIHSNSLMGFSTYIWQLAKSLNIPVIHTLRDYSLLSPRGVYETSSQATFPYNIFLKYYAERNKKASQDVSYVTAPSEFTLKLHTKNGYFSDISAECVVNAVDVNLQFVRKQIEKRKKNGKKKKTLIFAGRLLEIKGIKLLLDAFSLIQDTNTNLVICGEGNLSKIVEAATQNDNRIIYMGQLSQQELSIQYQKADVAVFPSLWDEPFGRIIIEANKYGLPVVASNHGGIPEIMNTIGGGVVFTLDTPECLSDAISNVLLNNTNIYFDNILSNIEKYNILSQIRSFETIYLELKKRDRYEDKNK